MGRKNPKYDERRTIAELEARNERLIASQHRLLEQIKDLKATISYRDKLIERLNGKLGIV